MFKFKNLILFTFILFIAQISFAQLWQAILEEKEKTAKLEHEFISAAYAGDTKKVKNLINQKVNVNAQDISTKDTALIFASLKGHLEIVEILLNAGADPNIQNSIPVTALTLAIENAQQGGNYKEIVQLLIKAGANVNMYKGNSALHTASSSNMNDVAELLILAGAYVNAKNSSGTTPLIMVKNVDMAKLLVDNGANIFARTIQGFTVIDLLTPVNDKKSQEILNFLTNKVKEIKESIFKIVSGKDIPLDWLIQVLSNYSKNLGGLNIKNEYGQTPLHIAITSSNGDLVKWIIHKDKSLINTENNMGQTPLELGYGLWANSEDWHKLIENLKSNGYISQEDVDKAITKQQGYIKEELQEVEKTFIDF